ncbi:MAG: pyridoxamine 5'-phosphate oxidase family protein [Limisphaerales bacterium]
MAKVHHEITDELRDWIQQQRLFFVASAPLSADGHVNLSPKGADTFRVLGPNQVAYLDFTGSGAETIAHLRENGRIVFMFCAFEGSPRILRLHGKAEFVTPDSAEWIELRAQFPDAPGVRSIIRSEISRVCTSCGFGVPHYEFTEERTILADWAKKNGEDAVVAYQQEKNLQSIDGLPALEKKV